ncbi:ABC transporter substrate-binding protein [Rhodococcus sp. WS3]|uniref:ABC transporter substrate-binding protein n=1 Tax=Rhodococcus sp. WS3 TaxID=2486271 RepID=UPI0016518999|nr:ABC transporter substrate-binding protein [Rhodococcus sp. WS3]
MTDHMPSELAPLVSSVSRRNFIFGLGAAGVAVALAGCGSGGASVDGATADGPPQPGGTFIVGTTQVVAHANPAIGGGSGPMIVGAQIFAGLVLTGDDFSPQPYLAESWEFSPDYRSLTFKIRSGATFHDGKPVTSEDVAFSILASKKYNSYKSMFETVTDVEAPDATTVIIRLSVPNAALLACLTPATAPILPKHIYGDGQDLRNHPRNTQDVIGSGPFRLTTFEPRTEIRMARYDNFFLPDRPFVDEVVYRPDPSGTTILLQLQQGEIHSLRTADSVSLQQLRAQPTIEVADKGMQAISGVGVVAVNMENQYLKNPQVRQAIAHAMDRRYILEQVLGGEAANADSVLAPIDQFHSDNVTKYPYDVAKAKELLAAAGYPNGFSIRIDYLPSVREFCGSMAEYMKEALKDVGITATVIASPDLAAVAPRVVSGDFDMYLLLNLGYGDPVVGVHSLYESAGIGESYPGNVSRYRSPEVDELLVQASQEMDLAQRKEIYAKFQKIVSDDLPVIPYAQYRPRNAYIPAVVRNPNLGVWEGLAPYKDVWVTAP